MAVLPLLDQPDEQRRLVECRVAAFNGTHPSEWVREAHIAWLAYLAVRLSDQADRDQTMLAALFEDTEENGRELLVPALKLADARALRRASGDETTR